MAKKEWTDEEVQAEIAAAVKIVQEDRDRARYAALHERFGSQNGGQGNNPGGPTPPPASGGNPPASTTKKKGLWWGETDE